MTEDAPGEVRYGKALLTRIAELCEADPGREVCGFVVRRGGALELEPIPNHADRYHDRDPREFPRTSRDGYLMDPRAQLRVHEQLAAEGGAIVAVYHSHVEVGAYFSAKDRADAVIEGVPVLPGAEYLVFGVTGGRVTERKRFVLLGGDFVERPLG